MMEHNNVTTKENLYDEDQLDRCSPVPLIYQLSEILRTKIMRGEVKPNEPIPPETELAATYGVSRTTVRLALAKLVNEGLIRREQGRGTFVNPGYGAGTRSSQVGHPMPRDMFEVKSTTHIIKSAGMKPTASVSAFRMERPTQRVAEQLDIGDTDPVFYIERTRLADDIPLIFEKVWVPQAMCPDLEAVDLAGSLYRVLTQRYGLKPSNAHQRLQAVCADESIAEHLAIPQGHPVMMVAGVGYLGNGKPFEVEESYFRGDLVEFIIELGNSSRQLFEMLSDTVSEPE